MKDEALKLALEALESFAPHNGVFWRNLHKDDAEIDTAITAIKQALEAPVQEPIGLIESLKDAQPCCGQYEICHRACTPRGKFLGHRDAQRQWVGLTDEEIKPLCDENHIIYGAYTVDFIQSIEAKLKEKNDAGSV